MIEAHVVEILTGLGLTGMTGTIGYFLKKQNDKIESVDSKIISNHQEIKNDIKSNREELKKEIKSNREELTDNIRNNKKEIVEMFQDICHERQGACSKLQDAKLDIIRKEGEAVCRKLQSIKADRSTKWQSQEAFNDRIKTHLAKENNNRK